MSTLRAAPPRMWGLPRDHALLVILIAGIALCRLPVTWNAGNDMLVDGGYYSEVARNVRDGLGLVSNISLYHAGVQSFPHPTSVYPLWPLVYGTAARVGDLAVVGHWLPTLLYFVAIVGAYLFGRAWDGADLFPTRFPGLHAGHVFALVLALHRDFVLFTAMPYTEGLAWSLLTFFWWRLLALAPSRSLGSAAELGVWLGLLVLCRSQFVLAPLAVGAGFTLFVLTGPDRLRTAQRGAVALGMAAALVLVHLAWVRTWLPGAGPLDLLRFDQVQVSDVLHPVEVLVPSRNIWAFLLDRASGLVHAWDPTSGTGYQRAYFTFQWALPLALPGLLAVGVRRIARDGLPATLAALGEPSVRSRTIVVILALGGLLSIQLAHKVYNGEWYFHRRQGLVSIFAFVLPLIWLLRSARGLPFVAGVVVLCSGVVQGVELLVDRANDALLSKPLFERTPNEELVDWLQGRAKAEGPLVVAMWAQEPQRVAWQTTDIGYHWFYEGTRYEDLLAMFDRLGARYLVFSPGETARWAFRDDVRIAGDFEKLPDSPDGLRIYRRR